MRSKRCSHNLQSNHRGNSQRFCKMLMSRFINLRRLSGQKELNGFGSCDKRQRKRHTENSFASINLQRPYSSLDRERKIHSRIYVLHKTLNLFISRCLFADVPKCKKHKARTSNHCFTIRTYCSTLHSCCSHWTNYSGKFSRPFLKPLPSGSPCKL